MPSSARARARGSSRPPAGTASRTSCPCGSCSTAPDVVFTTAATSVKGRALRRTGHACLCVDDERPPYAYVSLEGPVDLSDDLGAMLPLATRIGGRYMGADRAEELGRRNAVHGELLVRLRPEHVIAEADVAA